MYRKQRSLIIKTLHIKVKNANYEVVQDYLYLYSFPDQLIDF